jgi:hypothetical protein
MPDSRSSSVPASRWRPAAPQVHIGTGGGITRIREKVNMNRSARSRRATALHQATQAPGESLGRRPVPADGNISVSYAPPVSAFRTTGCSCRSGSTGADMLTPSTEPGRQIGHHPMGAFARFLASIERS